MAVIKCKMCGGDLQIVEGNSVCECEYCGSKQTVPTADNEKKMTLFARANRLLRNCEFDKASGVFETIVAEFPEEAEAYWGLVLCKYGIEYVDDPATGKKIPTCHRSSFDSVLDDSNFEQACENSDAIARRVYRDEARQIEALRQAILQVSGNEEPYDIFVSYKETDENGDRTLDSVIAQDIYKELTNEGYRVFFSRISLEDKLGTEYEPYIFAALNSAKVMLVVGTDYENFDAVWVKNEWSRFLKLIASGQKKTLIPVFKNMDAYDMPKEFTKLSALDMGKIGAIQDLLRGIGKIIGTNSSPLSRTHATLVNPEASTLVLRGNMALEDGNYSGAENFFERALDLDPSNAYAYLGKFLSAYNISSLDELENKACPLDDNKEFKRAVQFADPTLAKKLKVAKERNDLNIGRFQLKDIIRQIALKKAISESMRRAARCSREDYNKAVFMFDKLAENKCVTGEKCRVLKKDLESQYFALTFLKHCLEPRFLVDISSAARSDGIIFRSEALEALVKAGLLEKRQQSTMSVYRNVPEYCWPGAVEEKERILREEEERKQKKIRQQAAYDAACAEVNAKAQKEIESRTARIEEQFEPRYRSVQRAVDEAVATEDMQRAEIQWKISDLRKQLSSLSFFKGKEKKALQELIDEQQKLLKKILTPTDIQKQFQPQIDQINAEKQIEIETATADVYSKFILPKREDYIDV